MVNGLHLYALSGLLSHSKHFTQHAIFTNILMVQPSGVNGGSLSCPRTLQHRPREQGIQPLTILLVDDLLYLQKDTLSFCHKHYFCYCYIADVRNFLEPKIASPNYMFCLTSSSKPINSHLKLTEKCSGNNDCFFSINDIHDYSIIKTFVCELSTNQLLD